MITVPRNSPKSPNNERNIIPKVRKISDQKSTNLVPNFRAKFGAKGENPAKANNGSVVIIPANVFEICKLLRISSINGPTAVKGARKFAAVNVIPIISIICMDLLECGCGFCVCSLRN